MKRLAVLLLLSAAAFAQETAPKPVVITGAVFGDYYNVVSHHDPAVEGMNGFWFRRVYLTADRALSEQLSARVRFEMNQAGDFRTNATLEPFVKDAWVKWRHSPALDVILGLSPTPTLDDAERIWGYRSVEKTLLDLHRIYATRDLGVAVAGAAGRLRYHVQAGNGSGTGSETNEGKRIAGSVSLLPMKGATVEVYADFEDRPGDTNRTTFQLLGGIEQERYRAGVQLAHQTRGSSNHIDLGSIFGAYNINAKYAVFGRVDRLFDPNPEGDRIPYLPFDPTEKATTLIAGLDWKLHKNLSIIPNVEYVKYDDDAEDDLLPRITVSFSF
jgi:hypothetical protein